MSDKKIIDISLMKALKEHDSTVDGTNINDKLRFVTVAQAVIKEVIGKSNNEFLYYFKKALPDEVVHDFNRKEISLNGALEDLNILSRIERMIGMNPVIFSPNCTDANYTGWISGFHETSCMFSSPEMESEAKARAFTILLFLKLKEMVRV